MARNRRPTDQIVLETMMLDMARRWNALALRQQRARELVGRPLGNA